MILKLLGAVAVLLIGGYLAVRGGAVYYEGLLQAEGFLRLLRYVRERISCFRTPTSEILAEFNDPALSRAGVTSATAAGGLAAALTSSADRLYLNEEEMAVLRSFAALLGTGFAEEEVLRCDVAIRRMEEAVTARRDALPRSARLYRTLTVSAAAALVIVLI